MALYYLQESEGRSRPSLKDRFLQSLLLGLAIALLFALSFLQGIGAFWGLERSLIHRLPKQWHPEQRKIILLQFEKNDSGLKPMDVALALRGLEKLHPARLVISGGIAGDQEAMPMLFNLIAKAEKAKIRIISPEVPSSEAIYRPVPLGRYDPPVWLGLRQKWQTLPGSLFNKGEGCFLPSQASVPDGSLQLFAETKYGEVIPSLWWMALDDPLRIPPANSLWLLGGRILLLPNRSILFLNERGGALPAPKEGGRIVAFDDFLLQMEQKERGTLSPVFDALWNDSIVILGTMSDLENVAVFSSLEEKTFWDHFPVVWQLAIVMLFTTLFLTLLRRASVFRIVTGLVILLLALGGLIVSIRHGIIPPYISPLYVSLLLLISAGRAQSK
jgi:hypothetical protein